MAELKVVPEPIDGRYDLCKCGHSRIWHWKEGGNCVAEIRFFPEQMAQCSCTKFRDSGTGGEG